MENDLTMIMGADKIANELGMTRRQVYGLIYAGVLKTVKLGGTVAIRRSSLASWVASLEAA
ncbi:helix-turn-helix transcriptional regulator [Rhizobium herbae]|uniref:Excisionase family DNA binding protein n=1 Tax=Rhizobium herbae TaxID=508661 RepID=A0ABS4EFP4_9HYPH|nr:helix-turn-helix domain-containing protein [Rhizobium herbae]MBP1856765.1 excisionase family DNA binding protein [Rhizobium herbae]